MFRPRRSARQFAYVLVAASMVSALACSASSTSQPISQEPALPQLASADTTNACQIDQQVVNRSGQYSANVDLTASIALPGTKGVDVVMTPWGAIAAVNNQTGSTLRWIDPASGKNQQSVDLPGQISDIAFSGREIAIATENKILRINAASGDLQSEIALAGVKRVALADSGELGAIANKTIHLYNRNNSEVFSKLRDYTEVTDIELRSCGSNSSLYVTSFRNASFVDLNDKTNPVQIARLEAFDFTGEQQWSLFGDDSETIKQNVADTRLYRVTIGDDGYLYIGGESAGTATVFRWRGQPMTPEEQVGSADPFLTVTDRYSQLYNSGAAHLTYYARVNPATGELVTSQMSFPRRSDKKANAMRIGDIAAAADGTLYFGGAASASIANRENLTLNGVSVGEYAGKDRAWMAIAPNFQTRKFWTVLASEGGKGTVQGVDAGYGYSAALSNVESGTVPVTTGEPTGSVFLSFITE